MNFSKGIFNQANALGRATVNRFISSTAATFLLLMSSAAYADDVELYKNASFNEEPERPKVLIIFDDSGSMDEIDDNNGIAAYDSSITYGAAEGLDTTDNYIYYLRTTDSAPRVRPELGDGRRFLTSQNGCNSSISTLDEYGYYSDNIRRWKTETSNKKWDKLDATDRTILTTIDCEQDIENEDTGNAAGYDAGYPSDSYGSSLPPYTTELSDARENFGGKATLYTANYLRYLAVYPEVLIDRLEIAQASVNSIISTNPGIDFGFLLFNRGSDGDSSYVDDADGGGRVIHAIQENTDASKTELLSLINSITHQGSTPISESLFEGYNYLAGNSVQYGLKAHAEEDPIDRDTDAEIADGDGDSTGVYKSPYLGCDESIYVVIITDGTPTKDYSANDFILGLDGVTSADNYTYDVEVDDDDPDNPVDITSYLPALAGWMHNNDINTSLAGDQTAKIYTIGFGGDVASEDPTPASILLEETALKGGGAYYAAANSAALNAALNAFIGNVDATTNSFTSVSVAANNFDRTETLDSIYYAMFQPAGGPRWPGNLKKYKVVDGLQEGSNEVYAIDTSTGSFNSDVKSFWSSEVDGASVTEGGVVDLFETKDTSTRKFYYGESTVAKGLKELTATNIIASNLATELGVSAALNETDTTAEVNKAIDWILGIDTEDANDNDIYTEKRTDIFGDPLHSRPAVINYGENADGTDKIYIVIGTNHGVLHMFKDSGSSVDEEWAFMPSELIGNTVGLRENTSLDKAYGIDGSITTHIVDNNGDGKVNNSDEVWIYFGLRRGGNYYYAMDITDPADPQLKWKIEGGAGKYLELGQTWSQPKVINSKQSTNGNPVLVFGGGYDTDKDASTIGAPDNIGRAIYMVDAYLGGDPVWSLTPAGGTGVTNYAGTDSIPSSIATLDSDGDGYVDRLYVGDTGANIWRVDMPDPEDGAVSVFHFASLGHDSDLTLDRRFFYPPAIVRSFINETINTGVKDDDDNDIIVQQNIPYDALVIGSGDRTNPLETSTVYDALFMLKDDHINIHQFTSTATIVKSSLVDFTSNPFDSATLSDADRQTDLIASGLASGWFINLTSVGEKGTSSPIVLKNTVYFTSYVPPVVDADEANMCNIPSGFGYLYAVDLALGTSKYNWAAEDTDNRSDTIKYINNQFLGAPTLIITSVYDDTTDEETVYSKIGVGGLLIDADAQPETIRTHLYIGE